MLAGREEVLASVDEDVRCFIERRAEEEEGADDGDEAPSSEDDVPGPGDLI